MAGMNKGAGMIHPDMGPPAGSPHATFLGCILTDVAVSPETLQSAPMHAVERSFNSISADGDMSTNDSILVLANGASAPNDSEIDEERDSEVCQMKSFRTIRSSNRWRPHPQNRLFSFRKKSTKSFRTSRRCGVVQSG
jgi:N-acetylglutamate synthase/N-acetylornithine aminotransferase